MTKHCLHLTIVVAIFAGAASLHGQAAGPEDVAVTAVTGESWIRHLHTTFNDTRMGRTWNLGPAPASAGNQAAASQLKLSPGYTAHPATLHGSDLFRLNCRGCRR